jgi:vacuolar-type H+-ATPase subunit I/STV1
MERLNKIFAEWAKEDKKTELASEKVELSLVDDLAKQKGTAQDFIKNINSGIKEVKALDEKAFKLEKEARAAEDKSIKRYEKLLNESKKADKLRGQMDKLFDKIDKSSKELGLNPKDIKNYSDWDKAYDQLYTIEDEVKKYG